VHVGFIRMNACARYAEMWWPLTGVRWVPGTVKEASACQELCYLDAYLPQDAAGCYGDRCSPAAAVLLPKIMLKPTGSVAPVHGLSLVHSYTTCKPRRGMSCAVKALSAGIDPADVQCGGCSSSCSGFLPQLLTTIHRGIQFASLYVWV
jgi:hypothetical protein